MHVTFKILVFACAHPSSSVVPPLHVWITQSFLYACFVYLSARGCWCIVCVRFWKNVVVWLRI